MTMAMTTTIMMMLMMMIMIPEKFEIFPISPDEPVRLPPVRGNT